MPVQNKQATWWKASAFYKSTTKIVQLYREPEVQKP